MLGWHDQIKFRIQQVVQEKGMECTSVEGRTLFFWVSDDFIIQEMLANLISTI